MALVPCRECGQQVSTEAPACPHCGVPQPVPAAAAVPEAQAAQPLGASFRKPPALAAPRRDRPGEASGPRRSAHCRSCGNAVAPTAEICTACGTRPLVGRAFCQNCGAGTTAEQEMCVHCGVRLKTMLAADARGLPIEPDFPGLPEYYREEFKRIHESNESYKGKWNWAAFFLGPLWALTKGVWLAPVICFVAALFTWGIGGIAYWFIFGARGNYMYYAAHAKSKQIPI